MNVQQAQPSPELAELARAYGVATDYYDQTGKHVLIGAETITAVLNALGVASSTEQEIGDSLANRKLRDWRRMLPPVFVARSGQWANCWVHVPHGSGARMWIDLEEGGTRYDIHQVDRFVPPQMVDGELVGEATFAIPGDLPLGWHTLRAESDGVEAECPLVITPASLDSATLHKGRFWGFMTQVYSMRSARSWGIGDFGDLTELATWSASLGADHVLVNPFHAASPVPPMAESPYLPVTKRFANAMYLRIEDIPEYAYLDAADRKAIEKLAAKVRPMNTTTDLLERDPVWAAKKAALEILYRAPLTPGRKASRDAYYAKEGPGLIDWGTWCVLSEEYGQTWQEWPVEYRNPATPQVAAFRKKHSDRVDFYCWQQWLIDEQLAYTQEAAELAGMRAGIVHDLAVGVHSEGADTWSLQHVMATGVTVGAPPDMYNQMGQDWSQPPWMPDSLAEEAFIPYRDMLRTILRHAGGIRIDHVLGLFRLWLVPDGMKPYEGTYLTFDHEAMVGILVLEAQRAGAFVVGEDLGTVEDWIQGYLLERGVMGTSILWFERAGDGHIKRPHEWRGHVLASVTVHDLPPTAGYLAGEHVRIRDELGLLARSADEERADLKEELAAWRGVLREYGMLAADDDSDEAMLLALHRYLAVSPAVMLGIALPDAVGDRVAQNQPGTDQEYPNWRIPLTDAHGDVVLLEDLPNMSILQQIVDAIKR